MGSKKSGLRKWVDLDHRPTCCPKCQFDTIHSNGDRWRCQNPECRFRWMKEYNPRVYVSKPRIDKPKPPRTQPKIKPKPEKTEKIREKPQKTQRNESYQHRIECLLRESEVKQYMINRKEQDKKEREEKRAKRCQETIYRTQMKKLQEWYNPEDILYVYDESIDDFRPMDEFEKSQTMNEKLPSKLEVK